MFAAESFTASALPPWTPQGSRAGKEDRLGRERSNRTATAPAAHSRYTHTHSTHDRTAEDDDGGEKRWAAIWKGQLLGKQVALVRKLGLHRVSWSVKPGWEHIPQISQFYAHTQNSHAQFKVLLNNNIFKVDSG